MSSTALFSVAMVRLNYFVRSLRSTINDQRCIQRKTLCFCEFDIARQHCFAIGDSPDRTVWRVDHQTAFDCKKHHGWLTGIVSHLERMRSIGGLMNKGSGGSDKIAFEIAPFA